jgi:ankyrin repeat protein
MEINSMDKLTGEWKNLYNGIIKEYHTFLPNQHNPAADNITPIHLLILRATENKENPNFIELLNMAFQSKNVNINVQDGKGRTPLYLAIELENYDIANVLIDGGVDITIPNNDGISPLVLSAIQSSEDEAPEKNLLLNKLIERARPIKNERFNEHWDRLTDSVRKKIKNAGFQTIEERATAEAKKDCKAFLAKHGISNKKQFLAWSKVHHPNKGGNTWLFKLVRSCIEKLVEEEEATAAGITVENLREREAMKRETEEKEEREAAEREAREAAAREREEAERARREKKEAEAARKAAEREAREAAAREREEAEREAARKAAEREAAEREAREAERARREKKEAAAADAADAAEARAAADAERIRRDKAAEAKKVRDAAEAKTRKATTHTEKLQEIQRETAEEVGKLVAEMERLKIEMQQFRKEEQSKINGFFVSDIDMEAQKTRVLEEARRFLNTIPAEPLEEYVAVSRDVMINSILSELKNPKRNDEAIAQLIGRVFTRNKDGINTVIDKKGNTLLILTILYRLPEATLKLLDLGVTINIQNEDGLTALMLAIATTNPLNIREKGALRVITRLLENASLDVNLDSKDNNDAYDYASRLHSRIRNNRDKQLFKDKVLDKIWAKRATRARIAARRAAKGALGAVKGFFTIPDFNILGDM